MSQSLLPQNIVLTPDEEAALDEMWVKVANGQKQGQASKVTIPKAGKSPKKSTKSNTK